MVPSIGIRLDTVGDSINMDAGARHAAGTRQVRNAVAADMVQLRRSRLQCSAQLVEGTRLRHRGDQEVAHELTRFVELPEPARLLADFADPSWP